MMMKELILKRMKSRYVDKNKESIIYNVLYNFQFEKLKKMRYFK